MEQLFSIGLHNAAIMAFLAILAWSVTRIWKSAPAAHLLWLVVLLKLITPPVVHFDVGRWAQFPAHTVTPVDAFPSINSQHSISTVHDGRPQPESNIPIAAEPTPPLEQMQHSALPSVIDKPSPEPSHSRLAVPSWETVRLAVAWIWVVVAAVIACVAGVRIVRFRRTLWKLRPASQQLQSTADDLAVRMGLKASVKVLQVESATVPFIWCFGSRRAVIVPCQLLDTLSARQLEMLLAHELAHLRRRDHWVRIAELIVSVLYWWNPLVWWVRRELHAAEEECCDAWVAWLFPDQNHLYAESLLKSAEAFRCPSVVMGSAFLNRQTLKARVEIVLKNKSQRKATRLALVFLSLFTAVAIPTGISVVHGRDPDDPKADQARPPAETSNGKQADPQAVPSAVAQVQPASAADPTLRELIQIMANYERMYLPYDIRSMETIRVSDDKTPEEKARLPLADGRKHQKLMEYAQLAERIWRSKETMLVDDKVNQGPYESFCDGERITQAGPSSITINGAKTTEYSVNNRKNNIFNYVHATPLIGVFCLSSLGNGKLFSEAFQDDEAAVELAWANGDAKLTFGYGKPHWNTRFVLWLSRAHAWHPSRLQRFWGAKDELFFDEWEVTKFAQHGKVWRVAEGTHRYRTRAPKGKPQDPRINYSVDFQVLAEKYGNDVDEKQFQFEIPAGVKVRDDQKPEAESPPTKTREISFTLIDVANQPVRNATVRIPASRLRDLDVITTDENGEARTTKAPEGNATVHMTAPGFRPVTWIVGNVNELRAIIAPQTAGVAVDEQGNPVAGAWLPNRTPEFRADGFVWFPDRDFYGDREDWSGDDGRFTLKTDFTLRSLKQTVPLIAVDPDLKKIAIQVIPARELGKSQKLVLQPICHVHGHCLLEGTTDLVDIRPWLETSTGETIASVTTRHKSTPDGLRIDFQLRLPPGDYVLKSSPTSHHAGFKIPVKVPAGQSELDLGTTAVSAAGTTLLRGKPAPALNVQWRPGQEITWEALRGKVVVLDFWGTWCGPCVSGMPDLMEIADQFRDKPVAWLSIHTANFKAFDELDRSIAQCQEKSWNKRALTFTTAIDLPAADSEYAGKTSQRFGVVEWPTLIVVDQQGIVVGAVARNKLAETIARIVDKALDGQAESKPSTDAAPQTSVNPIEDERDRLQGHWAVETCESRVAAWNVSEWDARRWRWTIKGNEITWGREGQE